MDNLEKNTASVLNKAKSNFTPIFESAGFTLYVSDDHLSVELNLIQTENIEEKPTCDKIIKEIKNLGIKTELNEEVIKEAVVNYNNENKNIYGILVTKGKENTKGKDGWFELVCSKKKKDNIKTDFDEKFDEIISLKKDDLIGIIHLAENGKDGIDVYGKVIPAEHGKAKDVILGENVYSTEKIVISIFSSIDGFLQIKSKTISVVELLTLYEDVDYRTGNILGYGSLKVLGNVKNGSFINLKKNIDIGGYAGDSEIIGGENIKILGGFMGTGKGVLKSGGNVEVKFIQEQKVYSRGTLNFLRENVNAEIYVKDKIIGKGNHASIIGGYAVAGKSIEIYSAGNEYGITTILEVGYDYEVKDQLIKNRKELNKIKKDLKKIDREILEYYQMKRLNETMYKKLQTLAESHKNYEKEIERLNEENKQIIKDVRKPSDSFIKIQGTIYPGTRIIINRRNFIIREKLISKTFKLTEEEGIVAV